MTTLKEVMRKRYYLFAIALVLLVSGGVALFWGVSSFPIRSVGLIACVISAYLVRMSNMSIRPSKTSIESSPSELTKQSRTKLIMWAVGVAILIILGVAYHALYKDALHGYQETFPVYFFTGAALVCAVYWGYLISKYFGKYF
ncbi:MAG: hypothetical protein ABUS47_07315 [Steroidobacter sp.]